jgi:hypothetical protein
MTPERREEIRREVAGWPPFTDAQKATVAAAMRPEMTVQKRRRKPQRPPAQAA